MAAKYQLITELYRRTGIAVAKNPQAWQGFLSSACRNYKCRFDEQLLIYAQRPDAVAVAKLETWNRQFKRWVNKDSKGIAVFDPKGRRNTLKYYFDVSDTHEGYYGSRPVPIWQMDERYEQAVMERLSDRFGDVESTDLASDLMETAKNAVEDNLQDYFSQLKDCTKDSFLEELDDFNIEVIYRRLATNSVAFMLISRCGLDTNEFFDREDFADIVNFNTPATINAIGVATSDIAETSAKDRQQEQEPKSMRELVSALIDASPVPCVPVGELELPAYYDSSQQTIFVKKGLSEEVLFVSMAKEVSAAVYDFKHNESRDASDFKSFCVAYMVSSRYGVDTRGFDFSRLPREYAEMDTQAFKGELGTMRDVLGEIQSDMYKSMEKNKPAKNKEQER